MLASQVALSLLLLVGAGLFVRTLQNLNTQDSGISRASILIVRVEPKGSDQRNIPGTSERLDRTYRDLIQQVKAINGVRSASLAQFTPTNRRGLGGTFDLPKGRKLQVFAPMIYPDYFVTMGIPIVQGRDFVESDMNENAPSVAVVHESFARQSYEGAAAIGRPCVVPTRSRRPCEIVAVVKDSRYGNTPTGRGQMALHVRVGPGAGAALPRVREAVQNPQGLANVRDSHAGSGTRYGAYPRASHCNAL